MKKYRYIILIVIWSTIILYGQHKKAFQNNDLNTKVYGYAVKDGSNYLATEKGFLLINNVKDTTDKWQSYYRNIYKDSTITNPNTIVGEQNSNLPIQFFLPVDVQKWSNNSYSFGRQMYLYDFIQIDSAGNYKYRTGVLGIIGGIEKKRGLILPMVR